MTRRPWPRPRSPPGSRSNSGSNLESQPRRGGSPRRHPSSRRGFPSSRRPPRVRVPRCSAASSRGEPRSPSDTRTASPRLVPPFRPACPSPSGSPRAPRRTRGRPRPRAPRVSPASRGPSTRSGRAPRRLPRSLSCPGRGPPPYDSTRPTARPREPTRSRRPVSAWPRPRRPGTPPHSDPSLPQPRLQDLVSMESCELEVLGRAVDERIERDESDDLALRDLDAFLLRERTNRLERLDERRPTVVDHVHRDLHEASFGEREAFRADRREAAVALPDRLRDAFRDRDVGRPQVHIPRDQHRPSPDDACAGGRVESHGAEIRLAVRVRLDLDLEAFVLSPPHVREGAPVRPGCGGFIQIDWDTELVRNPLANGPRDRDTVLHRHARDRDERKDVEGADPRMLAAMNVHVDPLDRGGCSSNGCFRHRPAIADERNDGAVVIRVHLHI